MQASQAAQSIHHNVHTRFVGTSTLNVSVSLRGVTLLQGGLIKQTCFQMLGKSITCHFMNQACVCLQPPTMLWTSSGLRAAPYSTYDRSVASYGSLRTCLERNRKTSIVGSASSHYTTQRQSLCHLPPDTCSRTSITQHSKILHVHINMFRSSNRVHYVQRLNQCLPGHCKLQVRCSCWPKA